MLRVLLSQIKENVEIVIHYRLEVSHAYNNLNNMIYGKIKLS